MGSNDVARAWRVNDRAMDKCSCIECLVEDTGGGPWDLGHVERLVEALRLSPSERRWWIVNVERGRLLAIGCIVPPAARLIQAALTLSRGREGACQRPENVSGTC